MPTTRDTSKAVTKRMLAWMESAIKGGIVTDAKEFAEAAGMQTQYLYTMRSGTPPVRYFTLDHLQRLGTRYNLDMNYFIYGTGQPVRQESVKDTSPIIRLKAAVLAVEEEMQLKKRRP